MVIIISFLKHSYNYLNDKSNYLNNFHKNNKYLTNEISF